MSHETTHDAADHAADPERRTSSVDLIGDGVLWMLNRTVYHPRGFALGFDTDTGLLALYGNGSEPWSFAVDSVEDEKFAAHEALLERARLHNTP